MPINPLVILNFQLKKAKRKPSVKRWRTNASLHVQDIFQVGNARDFGGSVIPWSRQHRQHYHVSLGPTAFNLSFFFAQNTCTLVSSLSNLTPACLVTVAARSSTQVVLLFFFFFSTISPPSISILPLVEFYFIFLAKSIYIAWELFKIFN